MKDALKRVPGVGDVMIFGERKYAMRVWLDPVRLAARNLTATDVVNALVEQNVEIPAGQLGQPPSDAKQAFQIPVRVVGRLTSPAEFDNIIVKNSANGLVLLKDVGHSEVGAEDYSSVLKYAGHEAMGIGVDAALQRQLRWKWTAQAKAALVELSKSFPPGLEYAIAFDSTTVVGDSIREVLVTLAVAIVIVITVIFLFLLDWRATIIPAVTIPVSLIGTFAFIKLFGFSINSLTLFGITLATGLVVDDAIVVIENVQRHIRHGALRPARGHLAGHGRGDQRGHRHFAGADRGLCAGLVLPRHHRHSLPAIFADHRVRHRHLGLQRAHAFAGAVGHVPARRRGSAPAARLPAHSRRSRALFAALHSLAPTDRSAGCRHTYAKVDSRGAASCATLLLVLFFAGLGATVWVYQHVPTGFIPAGRPGLPDGHRAGAAGLLAGLHQRIWRTAREAIIATNPDIAGAFSVMGFSLAGDCSNAGMMFVSTKPSDQRRGKGHSAADIVADLSPKLHDA